MKNLKPKIILIAKFLLGNAILGVLLMIPFCPVCFISWEAFEQIYDDLLYSIVLCIGLGGGNSYVTRQLDLRISWIHAPLKRLLAGLLFNFAYSTLFTLLVHAFVVVVFFQKGIFEIFSTHSAATVLKLPLVITAVITTILTSRSFLLNWRQEAINAEKYKREHLATQFIALKNQVNPHFLFNSLNALTSLVYQDQDLAAKFIRQLSDVYRYVLENQEKEVVPLKQELQFIEAYIFMQKIRFGENLKVFFYFPEGENIHIAPLSLQLLVENAIKHNIISEDDPLNISLYMEGNEFIVVTNNLQQKKYTEPSSGTGLKNISERYQLLSDKVVQIMKTTEAFTVKLPVLYYKN